MFLLSRKQITQSLPQDAFGKGWSTAQPEGLIERDLEQLRPPLLQKVIGQPVAPAIPWRQGQLELDDSAVTVGAQHKCVADIAVLLRTSPACHALLEATQAEDVH